MDAVRDSAPGSTSGGPGAGPPAPAAGSWLLDAFAGSRGAWARVLAATMTVNVLALAVPLFTMNVYDRVIPNGAADTLVALAIGTLLAIGFDFALRALRAHLIDAVGRCADVRLANFLFGRLLGGVLPARTCATGVHANTLREYETLRELLQSTVVTTLGDLPFGAVFLLAVWLVGGPLVVAPLVAMPLLLGITFLIQRSLDREVARAFRESGLRNAVAVEFIAGLETLKALGAESWAAARWERAVAGGLTVGHRIRSLTSLAGHCVASAQNLLVVVMVLHGASLVMGGAATTGTVIAAVMMASRAMAPVGQAAVLLARLHQARTAYRALDSLATRPQERGANRLLRPSPVRSEDPDGRSGSVLTFDRVGFRYDPEEAPALQGVSFRIGAGERVAILGSVGSGKSTLLKLALALHQPSEGAVHVDGLSARHLDPAALRAGIGYVGQDAHLFSGTLRENVTPHAPHVDDEAVLAALRLSGALDWTQRLPRGLATEVGERGTGLSGGQRSSLALARATVHRPRLLLLDEPTGAMDGRTEQAFLDRLTRSLDGATLVVVTHRPAVLAIVDRLIVLEAGGVRLDGPKEAVLQALRAGAGAAPARPSAVEPVRTPRAAAATS